MLAAVIALIVIYASDQIVPATSDRQADLRIWLAARATGIVTFLLLTFQICVGLVLSHPTNKSTWKLSKRIFPWHENLLVFTVAFTLVHVATILLDPFAGVSPVGAIVPGLSSFRSVPVALGTLALYGLLIAGLTARYTKVLPPGIWLKIHRLSIVVWGLAWGHGILAGTDTGGFAWLYVLTGVAMVAAAAYRYWVGKQGRPSFATSLPSAAHTATARADGPTIAAAIGPAEGAGS